MRGERVPEVIVITGGTRGIGAATARLLAGPDVVLCLAYRTRSDDAEQVLDELRGRGKVFAQQCDISDEDDVRRLFTTADELGVVTGLVNSAGVLEQQCEVSDISLARWQRVFAVNVFGTALCCREAVARMCEGGGSGGSIVNVSSRAAQLGAANEYVDYAASKAAVDTLTRGLALEVARQGIRVNGVRPGIIDTDMHASGGEARRVDRLGPQQPLGRAGKASEVAEAIAWLLSPASSYITGAFLDVSGGR